MPHVLALRLLTFTISINLTKTSHNCFNRSGFVQKEDIALLIIHKKFQENEKSKL